MEVSTEGQSVLLESMEGAQFITIQRSDDEPLGKGVPLFTLNGTELISEGMVVDMINGVGTDYTTTTQYYETDDLLPHELTEEDRKLAAALVAVQLQQQQKQQQIQSNPQQSEQTLSEVTALDNLQPVNSYTIQTIQQPTQTTTYSSIGTFKKGIQNVKQELIKVKCEDELDFSAESSEDAVPTPGAKRSLPHKKRIPRKLKQQGKKVLKKENQRFNQEPLVLEPVINYQNSFKCEICGNKFNGQLSFFEHLKSHYEPIIGEQLNENINNSNSITTTTTIQRIQPVTEEEFSEPEDFMEGIRGVVEQTGAHIDDDTDGEDPLPDANNTTLWTISNIEQIEQRQIDSEIIEQVEQVEIEKPKIKKKKSKPKKSIDELVCPHCQRTFHHKNSLIYHLRSHSGERPHHCDDCGKSFFAASALKVHKRLHTGDKPYKCEECGRHFRQWGDLKYHTTSIHSDQKQFQCEFCGKDFARKYSLIVHRRIHTGEKNYHCEFCSKTFRASSYLQNHRRIHTGEKPHPCTVCGKPFRVRSDMKRHMLTHSRNKQDNKPKIDNKTDINEEIEENKSKSINEIVQELKFEMNPNATVVHLVGTVGTDDSESILPDGSEGNVEYTITTATSESDKDPLGAVKENSVNYYYL